MHFDPHDGPSDVVTPVDATEPTPLLNPASTIPYLLELRKDMGHARARSQKENREHMARFLRAVRLVLNDEDLWPQLVPIIDAHDKDIKPRESKKLLALAKVAVGPDADGRYIAASAWAASASVLIERDIPCDEVVQYLEQNGGVDGIRRSKKKATQPPQASEAPAPAGESGSSAAATATQQPGEVDVGEAERVSDETGAAQAAAASAQPEPRLRMSMEPREYLAAHPEADVARLVPVIRRVETVRGATIEVDLLDAASGAKEVLAAALANWLDLLIAGLGLSREGAEEVRGAFAKLFPSSLMETGHA